MKNKTPFMAIFLLLALSTAQAASEDAGNSLQRSDSVFPQEQLLDSAWEGTFSTLLGINTPIRLVFLPELNARGELQYFHRLTGVVASKVLAPDQACQFTPRALLVQSESGSAGRISIFKCVDSEDAEIRFEGDSNRKSTSSLEARKITLSPDGRSLFIAAHVFGIPLNYRLQRQALPNGTPTRQELRSWLDAN